MFSGRGMMKIRRSTRAAVEELNLKFGALKVPGLMPSKIDCSLDIVGQHTIQWQGPIAIKGETPAGKSKNRRSSMQNQLTEGTSLPTGSVNLYTYPTIATKVVGEDGKVAERKYKVEGAQLLALRQLVKAVFLSQTEAMSTHSDEVGAFPIHALVVGNTPEALELATEIFEAKPSLLKILHTTSRAGLPLFFGESTLHILCVNQQEAMLVRLLALAQEKLRKSELEALLHSQANGVFFESQPMCIYGSTALSYACVFDMREAIEAMLGTSLVTLNDQHSRCKLTGFLPLHAVIANGRRSCYEWMTKQLPWELRADPALITSMGSIRGLSLQSLNAMQLAAKLGQSKMFMEILRQQCNVQWVWGPVTCYRINLIGIDSAGGGAGDIMELVGELSAGRAVTEMLRESCRGANQLHTAPRLPRLLIQRSKCVRNVRSRQLHGRLPPQALRAENGQVRMADLLCAALDRRCMGRAPGYLRLLPEERLRHACWILPTASDRNCRLHGRQRRLGA